MVLAAGEGTRMYPLTHTRPKPLLPVAGKPILEHILSMLKRGSVTEAAVVVGRHKDKVVEAVGDGGRLGLKVEYIVQEKPLGTAHAASLAEEFVGGEDFILVNGDVLTEGENYGEAVKAFRKHGSHVMALAEVADPSSYGVVEVKGEKIVRVVEKPTVKVGSNLVNAGIYVFSSEVFNSLREVPLSERGEYEITDAIQKIIDEGGEIIPYRIEGWWLDVGYPWDLLTANEELMKKHEGERRVVVEEEARIEKGAVIHPPVRVGRGTIVRAGAYIEGPVHIGENAVIGPNCYVRPYTVIGDSCHIGNACEVKNSIIMSRTNVAHLSYVGDSIIGENVNLGAGTITANLRLDERNVTATVKGRKVDTKRRKMGAVIGDNVKTGIGVMIMPGVTIGANSLIAPGIVVAANVPSNTIVKAKHEVTLQEASQGRSEQKQPATHSTKRRTSPQNPSTPGEAPDESL
ncbi:MAG: bifunctional sugar-1-phosphate nucleotidylyltransferase/acetyltransferase [Candidatus Freyarchaeota archaeon]